MLSEILGHLHNCFEAAAFTGTFEISGGVFTSLPDSLINGQHIRISGSLLNDGVYLLPVTELHDETFTGTVYGLKVPPELVTLASEISAWRLKNEPSAFASESFGGYTYTRSAEGSAGWQGVFRQQLNRWRKI